MILRIVKMTFKENKISDFKTLFASAQSKIASFNGCSGVELMQDINDAPVFFTLSTWINPESLENYRQSELFKTTWAKTKILFAAKPEAWSIEKVEIIT